MPEQPKDQYDVDDAGKRPSAGEPNPPARPPLGRGIPRPEQVEPLKIEEDDAPPKKSSVHDLDVCPSCGGTMRGSEDLVCIRCGFDLKTMKKVSTVTGAVEVGDEPPSGELEPIIKSGNGEYWLPTILAAACGVVLLIGYLAGAPALYPNIVALTAEGKAVEITAGPRIQAILQLLILISMMTACGLGALAFTAYLNGMRLCKNWDDLQLGAARMAAIVVTMRLAAYIVLPHRGLEWFAEAIVQLAIFAGLSMALFRLKPRDMPIITGAMTIMFVLLWLSAWVVVWGTW